MSSLEFYKKHGYWMCINIFGSIKQNESEVKKYDFWFFDIFF